MGELVKNKNIQIMNALRNVQVILKVCTVCSDKIMRKLDSIYKI